jgi:hypothetical protein
MCYSSKTSSSIFAMFDNILTSLQRPINAFFTGVSGGSLSFFGAQLSEVSKVDWLGVTGVVMGIVAATLASIVQAFVLWDRWRKWQKAKKALTDTPKDDGK